MHSYYLYCPFININICDTHRFRSRLINLTFRWHGIIWKRFDYSLRLSLWLRLWSSSDFSYSSNRNVTWTFAARSLCVMFSLLCLFVLLIVLCRIMQSSNDKNNCRGEWFATQWNKRYSIIWSTRHFSHNVLCIVLLHSSRLQNRMKVHNHISDYVRMLVQATVLVVLYKKKLTLFCSDFTHSLYYVSFPEIKFKEIAVYGSMFNHNLISWYTRFLPLHSPNHNYHMQYVQNSIQYYTINRYGLHVIACRDNPSLSGLT